ncbi:MAG: hypothetical protein AAF085_10560, partial [Planctomycetota bacterium]
GLTLPNNRMPPKQFRGLPVYRCFNAVALDRYTDWSKLGQSDMDEQAKRLKAWQIAIQPTWTHFGRVTSADPARNHDRLSLLGPADLRDAVLARIELASVFDPAPDAFDVYADFLKQDLIERKLGQGMLLRMFDRAESGRPQASHGLRVRDAISLQTGREMVNTIQKLELRQVPFDHVTIEQTFAKSVQAGSLKRMLDEYVGSLPVPVTLVGFEAGGRSPVASAIMMETVLRLVFAQPNISGIYFAGLVEGDLIEDNAALLDGDGEPTAAGNVLDGLFHRAWTSDETGQTDERGNENLRVFAGWHNITATLPDGTTIKTEAYIPKSDRPKLIVLQATAAEAE